MHTSHDFTATYNCSELSVFSNVRTGAGLRPKKCCAGRVRVGMVCGAG